MGAGIVAVVITLVITLYLAAALLPEAQTAGQDLNATGLPLAGLFGSGGVIFVVIMAALVIGILTLLGIGSKRR